MTERSGSELRAGLWPNGPAYLHIAATVPRVVYTYRVNVALQLVSVLLQIYMLKAVWTAIYGRQSSLSGLHLHTLIASLTLANLQIWILNPSIAQSIQGRVFDGQIGLDLARPASFLGQMYARQVGETVSLLPFLLVAFPVALVWGGLLPPASLSAALLYALSLLLAYLIGVFTGLLLGLIAFWTLQMVGFLVVYRFVTQFFAGALVPLQFFQPALRAVATLLPFQAQAAIPASIYLGQLGGVAVVQALALQVCWVVALYGLGRLVWWRAQRRVVVLGG